jgi:hypothetical protein
MANLVGDETAVEVGEKVMKGDKSDEKARNTTKSLS